MPLVQIEVCDFKLQVVPRPPNYWPLQKLHLGHRPQWRRQIMDAISLVLGVKSAQLRSSQLKDLLYRGRRLGKSGLDGEDGASAERGGRGGRRGISTTGAYEYRLNDKLVTYNAYNKALMDQNFLVKAKNFLVFQGDVGPSPHISSSPLEYDKAKEAQDRATENATFNFTKRRGIAGSRVCGRNATNASSIASSSNSGTLRRQSKQTRGVKNKGLMALREAQREHDEALEAVRAEQAQARSKVMQTEKKIKKEEKKLDDKSPLLVQAEAQITHAKRKLQKATKAQTGHATEREGLQGKVNKLQKELASVRKAADAAQEEQRKASQHNLALTQDSLAEYRKPGNNSKVFTREQKTIARITLDQLKEKQKGMEETRETRTEGAETLNARKTELEEKVSGLQAELTEARQHLASQQSERTKLIQLEKQANEQLQNVLNQLMQAGADRQESEKEAKAKENLANLQRPFPGPWPGSNAIPPSGNTRHRNRHQKTTINYIEYIQTNQVNQATFIPLDTIQAKPINDKYRSFAKGARLAVDVIQYEPAVERAMHHIPIHHVCGNALVCDTYDGRFARYVCYEKGQEIKGKPVTLEGTIIHKSGLITGGKSTHNNSKKWDDKDMQGLQKNRESLLSQLRELGKQKSKIKSDDGLLSEIARLDSSLTLTRDDLNACKLRLTGMRDELKHLDKELKTNAPELKKVQTTFDGLQQQIDRLSETIYKAEDGTFAQFCRKIKVANIREYEERQMKVAQEEENEARLRFDNQIMRLTHQSRGFKEELAGFQTALDEKSKKVEEVKKTTSKAGSSSMRALKEVATMNDEIEKSALDRSAIYRKCQLEEIKLPLVAGNLKNVPMQEV
ncbi:Structural maintenance of chromosomes protein [Mycena kentingensis (nom. inval.)]|nr:Structural maintenance of chromosomes protein [Mycena kentingensis (nom. inval.)]